MKIKVFLVDDHHIVKSGLRSELKKTDNIEVIGEASNGIEALAKLDKLTPDVVILDISMPEMNGLVLTERIKKLYPHLKIIVFTIHDNKSYAAEMVRLGANGYILKDSHPDELTQAIKSVYDGKPFFSPKINTDLLRQQAEKVRRSRKSFIPGSLTARESDVLKLLVDGKSNKEIGKALSISVRTVETHRNHIYKKLNLKSLSELTKFAISEGMADIS